jgi:hypothetical protein
VNFRQLGECFLWAVFQVTNEAKNCWLLISVPIISVVIVTNIFLSFFIFFVANTFQIQPFHKGLVIQADVDFSFMPEAEH